MVLGHDVLTSERTQDIKISEDVSFDTMLLAPNTLNGLKASGFYIPSPIQLHGIPLGKCGFDLLLEAKSGTGKTAVFSVIALEKLNLDKGVQTLILAPTREIASQISDVIKTIGVSFKGLSVEVVMGGLPFTEDVEKFKKKVHIIVGSPGRVHHLIKQKHIDVSSVRLMVLDEADKLVEKSFLPDLNYIFSQLPSQKQIIMSSATYPESIKTAMSNYVQNAHHICPDSSSILLGIEQNVTVVPCHVNIVTQTKNRYEELNKILSKRKFKQCLVFCNYQVRVGEVHKMLTKDKWPADKLHGQQEQTVRLEALKILQEYQCRILVTTDLAARGIDASNVDLVINFEIPYDWQTYLHRIGRAGRFGSYGRAITILCEGQEEKKFKKLLGTINIPFQLNYLWSKEPFELDSLKSAKINIKDAPAPQPDIKEPEKQLGVKEMYDEFWKILSVDTTQPKNENLDIPTFESLCESFEEVKKDSNIDNIESFSDLLSSFQNHKIKSSENTYFKPIEVNRLIKPYTIFNRNVVLESIKKYKSDIPLAENNENDDDNNNVTENDSKGVHNNKDLLQKNIISSQLSKPKTENIVISETSDSDSESVDNIALRYKEKLFESKHNGHLKDSSSQNYDIPTASGSSEFMTYSGKTNSKVEMNKNTNNNDKIFSKVQISKTKKSSLKFEKDNRNCPDESDSISNKSDDNNYSDYASDNYISPGHNDYEKLLLAANLPTAFGKAKQKNIKPEQRDVTSKQYYHDKHKITIGIEHQEQPKIKTNFYKKKIVSESPDGEETEDSFSLLHTHKHTSKSQSSRNHVSSSYGQNQPNCQLYHSNSITEERQHQFNLWYQQLRKHMLMIEQSIYITEMSSPYSHN